MIALDITDHPYAFVLAYTILSVAFGIWIGRSFYIWRVKRLLTRIELLKMEVRR